MDGLYISPIKEEEYIRSASHGISMLMLEMAITPGKLKSFLQ